MFNSNNYFISQKIELDLTNDQILMINQLFGYSRRCYNNALTIWNNLYKEYKQGNSKIKPNNYIVRDLLKAKRKEDNLDWENKLPMMTLEVAMMNLVSAYNLYFKGISNKPKYHKKGKSKDSCGWFWKNKYCIQVKDNYNLKLQGLNYTLKLKESLRKEFKKGIIKECIITRNGVKYYANLTIEFTKNPYKKKHYEKDSYVGIDLGIKDFAITYNSNKKYKKYNLSKEKLKFYYKKIDYLNHKLSIKRNKNKNFKDSKRYYKLKDKIRKLWFKVTCIRKDYLHKLSTKIISKYHYIGIEDLKVSNLNKKPKNHPYSKKKSGLNKSISQSCWYTFRTMLEYKSKLYGNELIIIPSNYPSTQTCSNCGHVFGKKNKLTLKDRVYICPDCGMKKDRDINAAKNIMMYAKNHVS